MICKRLLVMSTCIDLSTKLIARANKPLHLVGDYLFLLVLQLNKRKFLAKQIKFKGLFGLVFENYLLNSF